MAFEPLAETDAATLLAIDPNELRKLVRAGFISAEGKRFDPAKIVREYADFLRGMWLSGIEFAEMLGISQQSLIHAKNAGIISQGDGHKLYCARENVAAYVEFAKGERQANTQAESRKRLDAARTLEIELRTAAKQKELVPYAEAEAFIQWAVGEIVSHLDGLPAQLSRDLDERARIQRAIDGIRDKMASKLEKLGEDYEALTSDDPADEEDNA